MLNIFNLFLFLFLVWGLFLIVLLKFSISSIIFGGVASFIIAYYAFKIKIIKKDTELIFLNYNFYRHFIKIYLKNFIRSLNLLIELVFFHKGIRPLVYKQKIKIQDFDYQLLEYSINCSAGLNCIDIEINNKDYVFVIHSLNEGYFEQFQIKKIIRFLPHINEDKIV